MYELICFLVLLLVLLFVSGQEAQDKESFFKVTPLIRAIEGQNNESYSGGWTFKKRRKIPTF